MKKLTILSLVLAGLAALPALTLAEDVPPKPPGGTDAPKPAGDAPAGRRPGAEGGAGRMDPAERLKMLTEKLGLSQDQQDKVKAIYEKNAPQFKELMAKGRENLTDADKTKFRELMRTQMEEIAAVLTPEQKEKMKELRPAGGERRKPADGAK
jgi:Spy/CpxP family protein refolding chaperone